MAIGYDKYELGDVITDFKGHQKYVRSLAISPNNQFVGSSDDNTVKVWDVKTGEILLDFKGHTNAVNSVAFSPDGKLGMSGSSDNTVKVFDIETGEVKLDFKEHTSTVHSVAFSPDGKLGMSGGGDKTVKVWDIETGEVQLGLDFQQGVMLSAVFSPDGKLGACGEADESIKVFDVETGETKLNFKGHTRLWIGGLQFTADSEKVISGSDDGKLLIWNATDGKVVFNKAVNGNIYGVSLSTDGDTLAFSSGGTANKRDNVISLIGIGEGRLYHKMELDGLSIPTALSLSSNGKYVVVGGSDGEVKVFSLGDLIQLQDPNRYLFKKEEKIYRLTDTDMEEIGKSEEVNLTKELFEEYGVEDLSKLSNFEEFYLQGCEILTMSESKECPVLEIKGHKNLLHSNCSQYEILCLSDKEAKPPTLKVKGERDLRIKSKCKDHKDPKILISADPEREDVPIAKPYGYTSPQLVLPTGDIRLDKVKSVNSMTIKANDENNQNRIIYSVDSGENWLSKQNGENVEVDIKSFEDIVEKGMAIEQFNSINEDWTNEILNNGKIRFGYYLDIKDIDDDTEIDQLEVNISMYGGWDILNNGKEYKYGYTNEQLIVKLFKGGTYKVNYMK